MAKTRSGTAAGRWRERLERWRRSGQTVRGFCEREGLSEPSFYVWRKRLARTPNSSRGESVPVFLPIEVIDSAKAGVSSTKRGADDCGVAEVGVEVVLPGGVMVRIGTSVDEARLRSVLRAVVAETSGC